MTAVPMKAAPLPPSGASATCCNHLPEIQSRAASEVNIVGRVTNPELLAEWKPRKARVFPG